MNYIISCNYFIEWMVTRVMDIQVQHLRVTVRGEVTKSTVVVITGRLKFPHESIVQVSKSFLQFPV